jgi:hypothetical protein
MYLYFGEYCQTCLFGFAKRHAFFRIHTGRKYPDPKPMKNDETIKHHGYVIIALRA